MRWSETDPRPRMSTIGGYHELRKVCSDSRRLAGWMCLGVYPSHDHQVCSDVIEGKEERKKVERKVRMRTNKARDTPCGFVFCFAFACPEVKSVCVISCS